MSYLVLFSSISISLHAITQTTTLLRLHMKSEQIEMSVLHKIVSG